MYKTSLQFVANLNPIISGKDGQELIDILPEVCHKFLELADQIQNYDKYVAAYDNNLEQMRNLEKKNENLKEKLAQIKQAAGHDLQSFTIMPVQLVPRLTLYF